VATKTQPGIPASAIANEIDELGALEKEFAPLRPKLARIEMLRKVIRAHFDASPPASPFEASGARFICMIGPRAVERAINYKALIKAIGLKAFALIARVTLGALEEGVPCGVVAAVVTSDNTGARSIKTFERGTAA
jgi:hypothetical protein